MACNSWFVRCALVLLVTVVPTVAQDPAAGIPEDAIAELQEELATLGDIESTVEARRVCKQIVRGAESLIEGHAQSPDRFRLLGIIFEAQKIMFAMRQSEEYRTALLETAQQLVEAPDAHARERVEADMMLLQLQFVKADLSPEKQALEVARFADRYRGTDAEAESLMMAATSAFDLGNRELLDAFRETLETKFSEDPLVTAFMRERFGSGGTLHLRGAFERADGTFITFPLGQTYLVCFWSLDTPLLDQRVDEIRAMQTRYEGQFKVFSFNLDELGDCGEAALRRMKLDWVPLRLPGGVENPTYLSVGGGANMFAALVVGPHGLAQRGSTGQHASPLHRTFEAVERSPRRTSLFRSLCIGDFLVAHTRDAGNTSIPADKLKAIQACFPGNPNRYRLTPEQESANYETAERLCRDVIAANARERDLWVIHNYRTIALLGMWRLSGSMQDLDRAAESAREALKMPLPPGAAVVPQFCLTTRALMTEGTDPKPLLEAFIEASGGKHAPGSAYAAALMLALEAHSRDDYVTYRDILLGDYAQDPTAWPVSAFLLEKSCASYLFEQALAGGHVDTEQVAYRLFTVEWKTPEGKALTFAGATNAVMNAVVFVDPAGDGKADEINKKVGDHLASLAAARPRKDLNVIFAFRSADTNKVAGLMKRNKWSFDTACLSDAEWQKHATELGLFSADRRPNVYLVSPNGTIVTALSGVSYETESPDRLNERIDNVLRDRDLALAEEALLRNDYKEYAVRLLTSFPLESGNRARHGSGSADVDHRRKLVWAYMQMGDWQSALDALNVNIKAQKGEPDPRRPETWCRVCHGHLHAMCLRVVLLRRMGAKAEAEEALAMMDFPTCTHGKSTDALWEDVERSIDERISNPRFQYLSDPKRYLEYHETNMRYGMQSLFGFGLTQDIMLRARVHEKLGNAAAARADRREAQVRSWPFEVREFDLALLHESAVRRRKQARVCLEEGEWKQAVELADRNIHDHEAEPLRCKSMCKICTAQVQSFGFRMSTLRGLGREQEAEMNAAMSEAIRCPPGEELESFKWFPVNRMYGGGSGINRLNFIDGVMNGENTYANRKDREYRLEFAADLLIRAEALEKLGDKDKADRDRRRAAGLTYPLGPGAAQGEEDASARYADLVFVADAEQE